MKNSFRRSLEELFSDFTPPEPEAAPPSPREGPPPEPIGPPPPGPVVPAGLELTPVQTTGTPPLIGGQIRNLRAQIWGNTLIVLAFIFWVAFLMASASIRMNRAVARVGEETLRVNAALAAGKAASELFAVTGQTTLAQDSRAFVENVTAARERLKEAQANLLDTVASLPIEDPLWAELMRLQAYITHVDSLTDFLIEQSQTHQWGNIRSAQLHLIPYYMSKINEATARVEQLTRERLALATEEEVNARETFRNTAIAWGTVLMLVILGLNAVLFRSIVSPLERLTEAATRLATGRLDTRVAIERADEFGRLAQAFNNMAEQLQGLYNELEDRVRERTRALQEANYALQRRAIQLEASAEVSRAITSIFNVDELMRRAVNLIRDRFGFYHAGIFLLDETGEWAVLREATGEAGAIMKAQGHRLQVGETSMVGWTALHRKPRIALDVGKDAVRFANPLLPYTRSEMTLPLMVGDRLLGVLNVQSTEEAAFDEDDIRTLQSMADQLAIAIENARRLSDEALMLEAVSPIFRVSRMLSTAATMDQVAQAIIHVAAETGAEGCWLSLFEPPGDSPENLYFVAAWRREEVPPIPAGIRLPMAEAPLRLETMRRSWWENNPAQPTHLSPEEAAFFRQAGIGAVTNIPLRIGQRPLGSIIIYRRSGEPFAPAALRLYEALTDMASVAVERARLTDLLEHRARQQETLRVITDRITTTFDLRRMLETALTQLSEALDASGGYAELGVR